MLSVFLAQDGFLGWDSPVDSKTLVCYSDTVVGFGMIELIALILEDGCFAQYGEAVSKAFRHEELSVILFCEFHGNVLSVGRRPFANVDSYVEDGSPDASNELALRVGWALEVQSAHDAVLRHAFVVLHKLDGAYFLLELPLREGFEEVPAGILEDAWLDDE